MYLRFSSAEKGISIFFIHENGVSERQSKSSKLEYFHWIKIIFLIENKIKSKEFN